MASVRSGPVEYAGEMSHVSACAETSAGLLVENRKRELKGNLIINAQARL